MSLLEPLLKQLAETGKAKFTPQQGAQGVHGGYNQIDFVETKDVSSTPTKLAVSRNREVAQGNPGPYARRDIDMANEAQKILIAKGVDTRFLQTFLSFQENGERSSQHASEGSLAHYINAHYGQLTREQIKNIFGQIVLGVQALHSKNLAHRDLKSRNVLVSIFQGRLAVLVCDLDTVIPVKHADGTVENEDTFVMIGGSKASPEIAQFIVQNAWLNSEPYRARYKNINLKADDCYALSVILIELIDAAAPGQIPQNDPILDLAYRLRRTLPANRSDIENVLTHEFFNSANKTNEVFFQELHDEPHPFEYIDEHRARAFQQNDYFLEIHINIKPIYAAAQQLDGKFSYFDDIDMYSTEIDEEKLIGLVLPALEALRNTFKQFNNEMTKVIGNPNFPAQQQILRQLQTEANAKMTLIQNKYAKYAIQPPLWKSGCRESIKQAQLEFQNNQISSTVLGKIIGYSIDEHKDTSSPQLTMVGKAKKKTKNLFLNDNKKKIDDDILISDFKLEIMDDLASNESASVISSKICLFLQEKQGGDHLQAFKAILTRNIESIAGVTPTIFDRMIRQDLQQSQGIEIEQVIFHSDSAYNPQLFAPKESSPSTSLDDAALFRMRLKEEAESHVENYLEFARISVNEYSESNAENKSSDSSQALGIRAALHAIEQGEERGIRTLIKLVEKAMLTSNPSSDPNSSGLGDILKRNGMLLLQKQQFSQKFS